MSSTTEPSTSPPISVLFVCLGNICRSTMAEGIFQHQTSQASVRPSIGQIDSCGTGAYHVGAAPDSRTQATLRRHGISEYTHRARAFACPADLFAYDHVLAMDEENLADLLELRDRWLTKTTGKSQTGGRKMADIRLFGSAAGFEGEVVEDPYYGGGEGFETAYHQLTRFSEAFLKTLE